MAPRATGRDRQIEKKAEQREFNRAREISPEPDESVLMGGGSDFHAELARRKQYKEQKMFACFEAPAYV